jgi:NAD-dependent DNA ligase
VVAGKDPGSKLGKAKELRVRIFDEKGLIECLEEPGAYVEAIDD